MKMEQARLKAQDLYNELYPSAVAFFNVHRETNKDDLDAQFEARLLLAMIAIRIFQGAALPDKASQARTKIGRDLLAINVDREGQEISTIFSVMLGLAVIPTFEENFRQQATDAITMRGNLSLDEEPESMPQ